MDTRDPRRACSRRPGGRPDAGFRVHSGCGRTRDLRRRRARRPAGSPPGCGIAGSAPGDVVALQLPNWVEAAATFWASAFLGAVVVPIVHFYGRKELEPHHRDRRAEGLHHHRAVRPDGVPSRPVRRRADRRAGRSASGQAEFDFDELLADEPMAGIVATDPASPALIAFTSGTTRDPEGRGPQPPDAGLRDPPAAGELPAGPRQAADRDPGRALHRHGRRVPDPGAGGCARST